MTLHQAIDEVGRHLMPQEWLGQETDLLPCDTRVTEDPAAVDEEATGTGTPAGRLNRAMNRLLRALFAGDVKAVIVGESGQMHPCPSSLWARPGIRAVFRSGELPVQFRVTLEGHRSGEVGEEKRWVLLPKPDIRQLLGALAPEPTNAEAEFRVWLAAKIDESVGKERPTKKRIWVEAQGVFGSRLPYRSFQRIWAATVPKAWRSPLRRRQIEPRA
jgi:hypothetical protein